MDGFFQEKDSCCVWELKKKFKKKKSWLIPAFPLCSFQGEHFGTTEATEAFFAMTRLFQSNDVRTWWFLSLPLPGLTGAAKPLGFWDVGAKHCTGGALEAIPALEMKG